MKKRNRLTFKERPQAPDMTSIKQIVESVLFEKHILGRLSRGPIKYELFIEQLQPIRYPVGRPLNISRKWV